MNCYSSYTKGYNLQVAVSCLEYHEERRLNLNKAFLNTQQLYLRYLLDYVPYSICQET